MRPLLSIAALIPLFLVACGAPCDPVTPVAVSVCHRADAGALVPNGAFVLEAQPNTFVTTCSVAVDGGAIALSLFGGGGGCSNAGSGALQATFPVPCAVPALPAGTYTLNTVPATTLVLPQGADGGVPVCP